MITPNVKFDIGIIVNNLPANKELSGNAESQ